MAPLVDPNLSHLESTYERDQQLQDLYVLALYSKLSKRKPTARQTERVKAKMAKEMYDFTERLYNPRQPNHEISLSGKKSFNEPVVGPRLSMISNGGQVLWECESSDPKIGSTLFVFKAEIGGLLNIIRHYGHGEFYVTVGRRREHGLVRIGEEKRF